MAKNIVVFGGTFDPVHFGHLITARAAAERCAFDRITLMPTASPPHKPEAHAAGEHRLAMLELAVGDDELFDISQIELFRTGPSYTLDTLQTLRREHGVDAKLYWIIGADMLWGLETWHHAEEVVDLAQIIVTARPPWKEKMTELLDELESKFGCKRIERIRSGMVDTPLIDVSSSEIRRRAAEGRPIRYLVPESVGAYIKKHGLYR
jgi:nicotinate-nucleotide adenylyltransferase